MKRNRRGRGSPNAASSREDEQNGAIPEVEESSEPSVAVKSKDSSPFTVTFDLKRQLGFALSVVLAFLGGTYWAGRNESHVGEAQSPPSNSVRFSTIQAEPEDFFPAAEFRRQRGLIFGCHYFLNTNPQLYVDIARAVDRRLPVFALVQSERQAVQGRELMKKNSIPSDAMRFVVLPANTVWVRDYAPFMIRRPDNSVAMIDAKYQMPMDVENRRKDEEMAVSLSERLGLPIRSIPLVLEGGNFLSNGDGVAVATNRLFYKNQEYEFTEVQIATMLNDYLGVRRCHLVPALEGESTGHVDMFMCFAAKNIAVVGEIPVETDPENSSRLDTAASILSKVSTTMGPLRVVRIPMPPPSGNSWRSYTNVVFANGILLMPSFSDVDPALEEKAENVYRSVLPGWTIKRIPCDQLVREHGQLHCISYNIPNYVSLENLIAESR